MTKPELLPCPFCGYGASFALVTYSANSDEARLNGQREFHYVNCPLCGANTQGIIGSKTQESAAEKWNRRVVTVPELMGCCANCGAKPEITMGPVNDTVCIGVRPTCDCIKRDAPYSSFNLWPANGVSAKTTGLRSPNAGHVGPTQGETP